jgi:predicted 3-demethylubiquinone-9 3-methyltransferase (glyoxalase superfamily)
LVRLWREEIIMVKLTPMLWFESDAEAAAQHYVKAFTDGKIIGITRHGKESHGPEGSVLMVSVELGGVQFELLNAGPMFKPTEANSYMIYCEDQAEVDRLWDHMSDGGSTQACGWVKDRWGFSWQIVPRIMMKALTGLDEAAKARAFAAMLQMTKMDIAAIEAAVKG